MESLTIKRTVRKGNFAAWYINNEYVEYISDAHQVAERILNTTINYLDFKQYLLSK